MCFTFKKNNKQTKEPVNCFLQDHASAGIQSLQTSIETKLCQKPMERTITQDNTKMTYSKAAIVLQPSSFCDTIAGVTTKTENENISRKQNHRTSQCCCLQVFMNSQGRQKYHFHF